jgi:glycosyltransferase involved in cell wall biosynthesis
MRIAYVVDAKYSALGISARSRAKINHNISIIEGLNYPTPYSLVNMLVKGEYDLVIFSWRFLAFELFSFHHLKRILKTLQSQSSVAVVIPDHIGEQGDLREREDILLKHIDYFLVTSDLLFSFYSQKYPEKCKGILHDIPDLDVIRAERLRIPEKKNAMIWVGNSKWGERLGFQDYKRLSSIVLPLVSRGMQIQIIDSAKQRLSNTDVLREINQSNLLIQCSTKEGTGLPLLEAAGLGVAPISTKVGVAAEILNDELSALLVEPTVDGFTEAIKWANQNLTWITETIIKNFESYCQKAEAEPIFFEAARSEHVIETVSNQDFYDFVRWFIRWCKFQIRKIYIKLK